MSPAWDIAPHRRTREAHLRKARRAWELARETTAATSRVWREHCRQHVKAARRENWLLVARRRAISASLFLRRTAGYDQRAHRERVGARSAA